MSTPALNVIDVSVGPKSKMLTTPPAKRMKMDTTGLGNNNYIAAVSSYVTPPKETLYLEVCKAACAPAFLTTDYCLRDRFETTKAVFYMYNTFIKN